MRLTQVFSWLAFFGLFMAQAALAQITLPPMTPALQAGWMAEIMAAAEGVFTSEGAVIAGGHSTTGAELTIGFTLTGVPSGAAITLSSALAGDALLLTRPIGTGVLLAAEMQGLAKGGDIARLYQGLTTPQGAVADRDYWERLIALAARCSGGNAASALIIVLKSS